MSPTKDIFFKKGTPESCGVSSSHIMNFITRLEKSKIPMHSFLLVRNGVLLSEAYYAPYEKDSLHRMYSITKSFTSIAIGFLEQDQMIHLDDPIINYFPEFLPKTGVHPYIAKTTIRQMLSMQTPHAKSTCRRSPRNHWVESFFIVAPEHMPGTVFSYDSSGSHVLAALVEKLTNMTLLDYLRSKFLNEINFSAKSFCLTDAQGTTQGASGLVATSLDIAKVAWIMMHDGIYNDKQYIPLYYAKDAITKHSSTLFHGAHEDERQGYGYQFWIIRNHGFAMYGLGGQLAICLPDKDIMLVTTADVIKIDSGIPAIYEAFWEEIYDNISNISLLEDLSAYRNLEQMSKRCKVNPIINASSHNITTEVNNRTYYFSDNLMGLSEIRLEIKKSKGFLHYKNSSGRFCLPFGIGYLIQSTFPYYKQRCSTSGSWIEDNLFFIKSHITDAHMGFISIELYFKDNSLTVNMKKFEEELFHEFDGSATGFSE